MAADPISAGIGLGGDVIGGALGALLSSGDRAAARRAIERAIQGYGNIPLPVLQQMEAQLLGPSAMEGVNADPALEGDQYQAIGQLGNIADSGGMTLEDRANYEGLQRDAAQRANAQRSGILSLLAKQGVNTGGASAALQLGAANEQAERGSNAALQTAASAQKRATQAVLDRAKLASTVRGEQVSEQTAKAQARDMIAQRNAAAKQGAQAYNLQIPQQQYANEMQRQNGIASAATGASNYYTNEANRTAGQYANLGTAAGTAAQAFLPNKDPGTLYNYTSPDDERTQNAIQNIG